MSQIGVDSWVAESEQRIQRRSGVLGRVGEQWGRTPQWLRVVAFGALGALLPLVESNQYVIRVGVNTLVFVLLCLGLNVVVGWAGLIDLGYVAFFGWGAYMYAVLSSQQYGIHWPAEVTVPLVVAMTWLLGLALALPSLRLVGDYLAIVTLFFGQIFVEFVTNANSISLPGVGRTNLTGGPDGIPNVDPLTFFGWRVTTNTGYFYVALVAAVLLMIALNFINESRTGRSWRSIHQDELAAELLGVPTRMLKLLAFAVGACIAGGTGTLFAALDTGVFPIDFDITVLITLYAMVVVGGFGSTAGVVMGAIALNVTLEVLRTPSHAALIFYGVIVVLILSKVRPRAIAAAVLAATIGFGFAARSVATALWDGASGGAVAGTGWLESAVSHWMVLPANPVQVSNYGYVVLVAALLIVSRLRRPLIRAAALVPTLWLAAFVWENLLVVQVSITRLILLGALLVVLMIQRPQGILGTTHVQSV